MDGKSQILCLFLRVGLIRIHKPLLGARQNAVQNRFLVLKEYRNDSILRGVHTLFMERA